jgi:hypothetical protein
MEPLQRQQAQLLSPAATTENEGTEWKPKRQEQDKKEQEVSGNPDAARP